MNDIERLTTWEKARDFCRLILEKKAADPHYEPPREAMAELINLGKRHVDMPATVAWLTEQVHTYSDNEPVLTLIKSSIRAYDPKRDVPVTPYRRLAFDGLEPVRKQIYEIELSRR